MTGWRDNQQLRRRLTVWYFSNTIQQNQANFIPPKCHVTGVHLVLVAVLGGAVADVEGVVEGDLVPVRHDLVDGRVVERGRQVAQQRGQALRGVQDVP